MKTTPLSKPDATRQQKLEAFDRLLTIMDELRENCPWDKQQTLESLRHLTIEETYELADAIIENDLDEIKKELGDLMLHLVFYAKIGSEKNAFDVKDVLDSVCDKLIRRHPHIYGDGDVVVSNEQQVSENWEKIKLKEKANSTVLGGVPKSLPAMVKAMRIQEKAKGAGFDWEIKEQVWEKVLEELEEFQEEVKNGNSDTINSEFGDILFSLINYARFMDINPEDALERTNKKFISRFNYMEKAINDDKKDLTKMRLSEMDKYWELAKKLLG